MHTKPFFLRQYKGTVIAVTHDRYFLDNVAGWILELDRGEGIPWKGNYSSWLEQKTKRLEMEEKQESKRRKTLQHELEWVRMAPKARQAKQKARLGAYEKLASADAKEREANLEIYIPNGPRLGVFGRGKKMNERKILLLKLSAAQFALWELHLYLDTHPCDRTAAEMCEKYNAQTAALKKEFEEKFGPLSSGNCENCEWLNDPWPWDVERGEN